MSLQDVTDRDRFAEHLGIRVFDAADGRAKAEMEVSETHLNGVGMTHGGVIFTLADMAFAAAANSHGDDAVAATVTISYLNAGKTGRLTAVAEEISRSRRLGTYRIEVVDESGKQIASLQGTAYRMPSRT